MFDVLFLVAHIMLDFLLFFKSMPDDVVEIEPDPLLQPFTNQANHNYLSNSINHPLDDCDIHHQCQKSDQTSYTYTFTSVVATQVLTVITGCSSCIAGSTSTLIYVTSTSSGPWSSTMQNISPVGPVQMSASNIPSRPAAVPSAANSIPATQPSTSTVRTTVTGSNAGDESTQTVVSTTNVVKESSSIGTANAVTPSAPLDMASPSAPMNTQMTVTIPVLETLTPTMSAASSSAVPMSPASLMSSPQALSSTAPPASNDVSSSATMAASTAMPSPVSPNSIGASSPSAQMSSPVVAMPSEQPSSPPAMPPQNSMPPEINMSSESFMPAQPSSPFNSNSTLSIQSPQASSPPPRSGTGSVGAATKSSMPPATNTNMSSGSVPNAKGSMLTAVAPVVMAAAIILL
ncbi:hypothetical protein QM012_004792 [Aureobasidium pullulans]|uniref:Uncharacterized protein n=1 Tax=Aureobasidium pullulans TaxID=5580 RepID=A0ABR0TTZ9_AURPU